MKKELYEKIHKEYLKHDSLCLLYELGHIVFGGLLYRAYAPSIYLPDDERRYVYFVNPKVANSSIKASILEADKVEDNGSIHAVVKNRVTYRWRKRYNSYYKFTFVRNPFERLFSCYDNKYHDASKWVGEKQPFKYYLFGYMREDNGFDEFVKKACRVPDWLMDQHLKPQYRLIYNKNKKMADYVGKYENLNEGWKVVQRKMGFRNLPHLNQSKKKNWMDYYNVELVNLVYERYRKDFELFGYEDEYVKLMQYIEQKGKDNAEGIL